MTAVVARSLPSYALAGERERLLAMVDVLESVPPEGLRTLARCSVFAHLDARDAVLVAPEEHENRLLLLLKGRARVYEEGPAGQELTVSVVEGGTLVGATGFASCRPGGCASRPWSPRSSAASGGKRSRSSSTGTPRWVRGSRASWASD